AVPVSLVPGAALVGLACGAVHLDGGYLAERNPVGVLPSMSLLAYWALRGPGSGRDPAVLGDSLADLPGAWREARWVGQRLGVPPVLRAQVSRGAAVAALRGA